MIAAYGLTKRYGGKTAVNDLSFTVRPGVVTGFLAPTGRARPVRDCDTRGYCQGPRSSASRSIDVRRMCIRSRV